MDEIKSLAKVMDISPQMVRYGTFIAAFIMLLYITSIALSTWILVYTFKLEKDKCECSLGWKHQYIQALLIISMILPVISLLTSTFKYGFIIDVCIVLLSLIYIPVVFTYIRDMEKSQCGCSADPARTALKVINYINIASISLLILFLIVIPLISNFLGKKETTRSSESSYARNFIVSSPISAPARSANILLENTISPKKTSSKRESKRSSKSKSGSSRKSRK